MKTTAILAAAIFAISVGSISVEPAQAASVTITTNDGYRHDNGRHLGWYKGKHKGWRYERRHSMRHRDCITKTVRYWHHHRLVVEKTRICH